MGEVYRKPQGSPYSVEIIKIYLLQESVAQKMDVEVGEGKESGDHKEVACSWEVRSDTGVKLYGSRKWA
jgi:hypothetical protein